MMTYISRDRRVTGHMTLLSNEIIKRKPVPALGKNVTSHTPSVRPGKMAKRAEKYFGGS